MAIDLQRFAQQIIDASDRIRAARTGDEALEAFADFRLIAEDHVMLRLLASTFQLTSQAFIDELDNRER